MPEIRAVLFDLDDTLIDRRSAYNDFYRSFYDRHDPINSDISWPQAKEFFWTLSSDNATNPRQAFATIQARWPGVTGDPESHYHDYFSGLVSHIKPLPGAMKFIDALNSNGLPWGVVTNGGEYQLKKVEVTGLTGKVPFVIATELHGANKPDSAPYLQALKMLKLSDARAGDVLFVGDNPHTDIAGAHAVGMQTAWIHMDRPYPENAPQPDLTIGCVSDLAELLGL